MVPASLNVAALLDRLEAHYGPQEPNWPVDPFEFLVWWHCGYPASDAACERGWQGLKKTVRIEPALLLAASPAKLTAALKGSGMFPELRAMRLKEVAERVVNEFGGDLRAGLVGPIAGVRRTLKKFPGISDPGADRILLFGHIAPIAAVPSNCVQVLMRIAVGNEGDNYNAAYRQCQAILDEELPKQFHARTRAYLLLKQHGQTLCKRTNPKCESCPVRSDCAFIAAAKG